MQPVTKGMFEERNLHLLLFPCSMGPQVCAAVRTSQVVLVLGATGCGKTTQIPQLILESEVQAGRACRILALPSPLPPPQVCAAVRAPQVVLVLGATGCGKTTQIPQLILESEVQAGRPCRILASQPRRLSASSVAQRVAAERGSPLGASLGYKVRGLSRL
jgi:HrpA-like RNA helicase